MALTADCILRISKSFSSVFMPYFIFIFCISNFKLSEALEVCEDSNYWCEEGHCCGHGRCCTYYYELWWFWLIWALIAIMTICCFYQHRKMKRRAQQNRRERQRSGRSHFYQPIFEPDKMVRLPSYEEASDTPKDPPAYDVLDYTTLHETAINCERTISSSQTPSHNANDMHITDHQQIDESPSANLLDNAVEEYTVDMHSIPPPPYHPEEPAQS